MKSGDGVLAGCKSKNQDEPLDGVCGQCFQFMGLNP
jgi:hypothetical protein